MSPSKIKLLVIIKSWSPGAFSIAAGLIVNRESSRMYLLTPVPLGQLGKGEVVLEKTCIWTCSQGHGHKGLGGIECEWRGNFDHLRAGGPESPLILQVVRRNSIYLNRRSVRTVTAERIGSPSLCLPCKLPAHNDRSRKWNHLGQSLSLLAQPFFLRLFMVFKVPPPFLYILHDCTSLSPTDVSV